MGIKPKIFIMLFFINNIIVSFKGMNIVSKIKCNITSSQFRDNIEAFLPERVMLYVQSLDVKNSYSVNILNMNLEYVKKNHIILKGFWYDHHEKCLTK